jgi:hypothetical protein
MELPKQLRLAISHKLFYRLILIQKEAFVFDEKKKQEVGNLKSLQQKGRLKTKAS